MASDPRWTEDTLELVASRGAGAHAAHDILEALASAGVLLPPGGETREEWGVEHPTFGVDGPVRSGVDDQHEALARRLVAAADNLTLVRRTIHTTPWRELPDA